MDAWITKTREDVKNLQEMAKNNKDKIYQNKALLNLVSQMTVLPAATKMDINPATIRGILETTATAFDISIKLNDKIDKFRKRPQKLSDIALR